MGEASLYERLGGVFAIAAVVDHFSDAVIANPKVGQRLREPAAGQLEHPTADPAAGTQVHADAVGVQRRRRAVRVRRHASREHAPRPGRRPSRPADQPGGVRRGRRRS